MLKPVPALAVLVILTGKLVGQNLSPGNNKLFLVGDDHRKEWCAYASESSWKSQVDSSGAGMVATMDLSNGHLTAIDVTTQDETGDWMVFDHYILSGNGELQELQRKVNILPGDRSVSETFLISDQKAKLQNRKTTSLSKGDKPTSSEDWLPDVAIFTRLKDFPFGALTTAKYSDVLSKGKICARSRGRETLR